MPTALFSLSDKRGLVELARGLHVLGWSLLASGGTATALRAANLSVQDVAEYTGSPEILGGRVKTLHPAVHGGILARSSASDAADLEKIHAAPIDLVAVNLYPFVETINKPDVTLDDAIENIDIGGVALIRAAAKNYTRVAILTDPADYPRVLAEIQAGGQVSAETRRCLAEKAFAHTAAYDTAISAYLTGGSPLTFQLYPLQNLRYGENPHQQATLYAYKPGAGPLGGELLQGKALSYNNILDLDAAWRAVTSFERPSVCIVKHLSPCGIASAGELAEAFGPALASDPISAYGGIIATNRPFDGKIAASLGDLFVECIIAPGFTSDALEILAKRKNCRVLSMPDTHLEPPYELRSVNQSVLRQSLDTGDPQDAPEWKVVSRRVPTESELQDLRFAWKACQHVKSNAIVFAKAEATVGIGGGQPNRVNCVQIAAARAGERSRGSVMHSNAYFPFPDSVEDDARAGITAIVQPGGSVRDAESIAAADKHDMAMVVTGVRHFRH
ncbi:MAG: bifunctional phosphoribosylaminoimidazolecarboxamide formyltransferase/IMP cyclohydrolase PurH [Chloroflexota bacterium]|nr:MAG: bifunctional phosphoribosylaminoimidazolecarboxamide formyltransferase/IMP cyclohydrolase PurH [Chloroflexota bacterium]